MKRMRTTGMSVAMAFWAALSLVACGGGDTPDTAGGGDTPEPAGTSSSVPSTPLEEAAPPPGGSDDVSAKMLCDYLSGELPDLRAIGSEVGAMANLTVNLFTWYEKQGAVPSGSQIDEQTLQECPDVRTDVLEIAGIDSFATL